MMHETCVSTYIESHRCMSLSLILIKIIKLNNYHLNGVKGYSIRCKQEAIATTIDFYMFNKVEFDGKRVVALWSVCVSVCVCVCWGGKGVQCTYSHVITKAEKRSEDQRKLARLPLPKHL